MTSRIAAIFLITFVSAISTHCNAQAIGKTRNITPESMGFSPFELETESDTIRFYVSTGGKALDKDSVRPLVIYLEGSGPTPVFWKKDGQIGSSLMFEPGDFPGCHYAVISKPGIGFFETERRVNSKTYDQKLSLTWRVNAARAVVERLTSESFVDKTRVIVIGHSEGADVAPWVALDNKHVTHVVGLAPGGVSQMFDFVLFARKQVDAGELEPDQVDQEIAKYKNAYRKIFTDPSSTDKKWQGETYLRWSSFFRPAMDAWRDIEIPVYLGMCRDDKNTPVECGEAIELEYIRLGKNNLTAQTWPTDHYFVETQDDDTPVDRRLDVLKEVIEWAIASKD